MARFARGDLAMGLSSILIRRQPGMGDISPDALSARADALIRQLEGLQGESLYPSDPDQAREINSELDMLREYQSMLREGRRREFEEVEGPRLREQTMSFSEEAARLQAKVERMTMESEEYEQATSLLDMSQPLDRILAARVGQRPVGGQSSRAAARMQAYGARKSPDLALLDERIEQQAQRRHELYGGGPSAERLGLPAPRSPERAAHSRAFAESPGLREQLKTKIEGGYTPRSYGGVMKFGAFRRGAEGAYEPIGEFDPWKRKRPGTIRRR